MKSIEQVISELRDRNLSKVAKSCGVSYDVVWRVANGKAKQPSYAVVKALSDYLEGVTHGGD